MKASIGLIVLCLGALAVVWGSWKLWNQKQFVDAAIKATGVIVGYEYADGNRIQRGQDTESGFAGRVNTSQASPVISFETQQGETIEFVSSTTAEAGASEQVELLYLSNNPSEPQLTDFFSLWGWVLIIIGFGVILMVIGMLLRFIL
ncbi:DUF3592 domain-containing protein [Aestuariibacter salexigens]|uniref:DUF3592 domain-containing protein n=1 Tax=Aestuariibacter salexigens TaxID=226010 RepID=UPI000418C96D|nr:DUF3592 domain-containing protein [Aestuariibacter salexigens]